jgi:FAD/FMN-containing dehydrogenase/Fe-S oxidoreductase
MTGHFEHLASRLKGDIHYSSLMRAIYATDASMFREWPLAVVLPKDVSDLKILVNFAREHRLPLIARTAGTSLAGQCVGKGIVVDTSRYMNRILELNQAEKWVRVEPGVIRDELNAFLKPFGLHFGPNTATANRCMIGGMVGNNSCGSTSIVYGTTREHVLELKTILSDGSEVSFSALDAYAFRTKLKLQNLEGAIYRSIYEELRVPENQANIKKWYPKPEIHRRNTGYAVDILLKSGIFTEGGEEFNFCKLLCGSEGTLALTSEIKLNLEPLPEPDEVVVAAHFSSIRESMEATVVAMQHKPSACELMDKVILDCTKENITQRKNRFFIEGDPAAVLMIEFRGKGLAEIDAKAEKLIADLNSHQKGYAFTKVFAPQTKNVWALRAAGLGLLSNIKGDKKAVECIEDTAVALEDLPDYIDEFGEMMAGYDQGAVYYAHAGAGELHLRPILDLRTQEGNRLFHDISEASARLVKKYNGSLSGEHGDGRVRSEFIPIMLGEDNMNLLRRIKQTWDPEGIFNPGKILDAPPMNQDLRYEPGVRVPEISTIQDFSEEGGILRMAEKCSGSADCRKLPMSGGTMCPSYMATRNERDTTRARANALREFLSKNIVPNPFNHKELYEVMSLCLSCKGCTSECPSNVDMASLKAEFLYQYFKSNRVPLRSWAIANIGRINSLLSVMPRVSNFFMTGGSGAFMKRILNIAPQRSMPKLGLKSTIKWYRENYKHLKPHKKKGEVYLFCDEFTNYQDPEVGIATIRLLYGLGYEVLIVPHAESGRAHISKGLLDGAKSCAEKNIRIFAPLVSSERPLVGVEPSAILGFRDEYPRLVSTKLQADANRLKPNTYLLEEFIMREFDSGKITQQQFDKNKRHILLHGHCHQKALSELDKSAWVLGLPENHEVEVIPSGCCGMAGSFGFEKEHYDVSMQIGGLILFPSIKRTNSDTVVVAPGTSCRQQIADGTGRKAVHPAELLLKSLITE